MQFGACMAGCMQYAANMAGYLNYDLEMARYVSAAYWILSIYMPDMEVL